MSQKYNTPRPQIPAEVERSVKVEAGHNCAIKGCPEHTYLEIHHINEDRDDNRIDNLILLCDKHHKMAHAEVIDRKSLKEYKKLLCIPESSNLSERFEKLEANLFKSGVLPVTWPMLDNSINLILEEGILLGNKLRGTAEGNKFAEQIFSLVKNHGTRMRLDSIDLLVRREDTYSRTGLSALGILYDEHFMHAKSLQLPNYFASRNLMGVAYYCALRESVPEDCDFSACMKSRGFTYGGLVVHDDDFDLMSKYPNRGPSVVLDFLVEEESQKDI